MKWLWLLAVIPSVCLGRIVQIDDAVKQDKGLPVGAVIHETSGHVMEPDRVLPSQRYREEAMIRYCYAGVVKEGARLFLKVTVHNLLLEEMVDANRVARSNSKGGPLRKDSMAQAREIELLIPLVEGRSTFQFPINVVTPSRVERVEVMEALLRLNKQRLVVVEVVEKTYPASKLPWLPPGHWPDQTQTIYIGAEQDETLQPPP